VANPADDLCFAAAFFCLSQTLRTVPLGIAYAIWCYVGIVLTALSGWFVFGNRSTLPRSSAWR
jgi:small multidrug resistance pump